MAILETKKHMESEKWKIAANKYKEYKRLEAAAKASLSILKDEMLEMAAGSDVEGSGVTVAKRKGAVSWDYKKFTEDNDIVVPDKYKKQGKDTFTVTIAKPQPE